MTLCLFSLYQGFLDSDAIRGGGSRSGSGGGSGSSGGSGGDGGGYLFQFPDSMTDARNRLKVLRQDNWIDRQVGFGRVDIRWMGNVKIWLRFGTNSGCFETSNHLLSHVLESK